jgi:hypothetical protein
VEGWTADSREDREEYKYTEMETEKIDKWRNVMSSGNLYCIKRRMQMMRKVKSPGTIFLRRKKKDRRRKCGGQKEDTTIEKCNIQYFS